MLNRQGHCRALFSCLLNCFLHLTPNILSRVPTNIVWGNAHVQQTGYGKTKRKFPLFSRTHCYSGELNKIISGSIIIIIADAMLRLHCVAVSSLIVAAGQLHLITTAQRFVPVLLHPLSQTPCRLSIKEHKISNMMRMMAMMMMMMKVMISTMMVLLSPEPSTAILVKHCVFSLKMYLIVRKNVGSRR